MCVHVCGCLSRGVCAHACVRRGACVWMCMCVHTRVCTSWLWCEYMRVHMCIFGDAHLCACMPVLWGAHLEKTQGSWSSGVSSPGLCPCGLGPSGGSSPSRISRLSLGTRQGLACAAPQHLIPVGCTPSGAAAGPCPQAGAPPGCRGRFGDVLPGQLLLRGPVEHGHSVWRSSDCNWPPVTCVGPVAPCGPHQLILFGPDTPIPAAAP